jgi:lactate dehydrogenase-like 2-hydroxyacid dehydrogenase
MVYRDMLCVYYLHPLTVELGAGYDQVDVKPCTQRGIRVSNVPTAVDDATADINMFLMLGALRGLNTSMTSLREGKWRGQPAPPLGHDPEGKLLGILGMGGIGRNLRKKAEAFSMRIQYHNRNPLSEELAGSAKYVSFEELLATSDVISLNLPLNVSNISQFADHSHTDTGYWY